MTDKATLGAFTAEVIVPDWPRTASAPKSFKPDDSGDVNLG
jgi:hypothetical protein